MALKEKLGSLLKNKKVLIGVGAIGLLYLMSKRASADSTVELVLKEAKIGANEPVTAASYRVIAARRGGMNYTEASGSVGGELSFSSPTAGTFTRNVIEENGVLLVEIA